MGVDASTKFFKVYDFSMDALGLEINQLRHIITPNVRYRYTSKPTHVREDLSLFDSTDNVDHENFFRFDLENKLQTKSMDGDQGTRTLVRSIVFADLAMPAGNRSRLERIGMDIEFHPNKRTSMSFDTLYDFETDDFRTANLDMIVKYNENIWFGMGQRYVNGSANQTTAHLAWKINEDFRARFYERFEFADNMTDEFEATLEIRNLLCWTTRMTYNYRDGGSFYVSFAPTAFPETAFQSNQFYRPFASSTVPYSDLLSTPE